MALSAVSCAQETADSAPASLIPTLATTEKREITRSGQTIFCIVLHKILSLNVKPMVRNLSSIFHRFPLQSPVLLRTDARALWMAKSLVGLSSRTKHLGNRNNFASQDVIKTSKINSYKLLGSPIWGRSKPGFLSIEGANKRDF